ANRNVGSLRAGYFPVADHQRRDMAAVHIFETPIAVHANDDEGGVFFADMLLAEEAVDGAHDVTQRHASEKMRIDHTLQSRGQQGRGNSLPTDISNHRREFIVGFDSIVEIAADL